LVSVVLSIRFSPVTYGLKCRAGNSYNNVQYTCHVGLIGQGAAHVQPKSAWLKIPSTKPVN